MTLCPDWLDLPETKTLIRAFDPGTLRFVGGAVRDALLSRPVVEVDAATTLAPDATTGALTRAGLRAIPTGIEYGTVTALVDGRSFEITTLRRDIATDGRHATVAFTDAWQEDAARRDFTMNALYLSPEGELFDYFGGGEDARAGRVRFIGDPTQRIREDYLRILRFFRFHAGYGVGAPDSEALAACAALAPGIAVLSSERVQQEMLKLLPSPGCVETLRIVPPRVMAELFGTPVDLSALSRLVTLETKVDPILRLAALTGEHYRWPARRWKLSGAQDQRLAELAQARALCPPDLLISGQKKLIRRLGSARFSDVVTLAWAQSNDVAYAGMRELASTWVPPVFPVSGEDLKALGFKEGRALGDKLRELEARWEASDYRLSKTDLLG